MVSSKYYKAALKDRADEIAAVKAVIESRIRLAQIGVVRNGTKYRPRDVNETGTGVKRRTYGPRRRW